MSTKSRFKYSWLVYFVILLYKVEKFVSVERIVRDLSYDDAKLQLF